MRWFIFKWVVVINLYGSPVTLLHSILFGAGAERKEKFHGVVGDTYT